MCKELRCAVFLDSGSTSNNARFDIFSAEPTSLVQKKQSMLNAENDIKEVTELPALTQTNAEQKSPDIESYTKLPFTNGLIGFCSYNFGEKLQLKELTAQPNEATTSGTLPSIFVGHYSWSYVFDHKDKQGYLTFSPLCSTNIRQKILDLINDLPEKDPSTEKQNFELSQLKWIKSQSLDDYLKQFKSIQQYIRDGDCYQVNLTQRFETYTKCSAVDHYFTTREQTQTPYSCYIAFNQNQSLLSFSPEQFISIKNRVIESKPIKGTIANNGKNENLETLKNSKKNQAENVMIVDLIRNDLGKVCLSNSIHVPELFKVESYNNVHHLVSHIKGTLKHDVTELDAFLACFPGGSITGAPKIRAMEIISELEISSRDAYCGSVFYLNQHGNFDSNILIRTVVQNGEQLFCWAGGGIVADSEVMDEYQESLTKVANITGITE